MTIEEVDEFRKDSAEVKFLKNKIIEQVRKEMVKEILSMIDKVPTNEVNELNHLRLLKSNIAKQCGVEE